MANVLVVDDEADIRALVVRRLQEGGHRVLDAYGAVEATALIRDKGPPDVVVLDVSMPGIDGLELLSRVRAQTGHADLPAVFLSGRVQPEDIAAGDTLGAIYLTKPFVATALLAAVEHLAPTPVEAPSGW
ncbi:MAG TPA: response regulator [Egibacteraceae bacterium]|nr:response regulator [Egibacteraceae bacterium]